jgi:hypothetical protein
MDTVVKVNCLNTVRGRAGAVVLDVVKVALGASLDERNRSGGQVGDHGVHEAVGDDVAIDRRQFCSGPLLLVNVRLEVENPSAGEEVVARDEGLGGMLREHGEARERVHV